MNKSKYTPGTRVKIINPEIFIRCGYPETMESAENKLRSEYTESLERKIQKEFPNLKIDPYMMNNIINQLTRAYNKNNLKFGGNERKIYTQTRLDLKDEIATIMYFERPLIKKTGVYCRGTYGYGDYDCDPPYLSNIKTHVFYPIGFNTFVYLFDGPMWIEKCNLEIV